MYGMEVFAGVEQYAQDVLITNPPKKEDLKNLEKKITEIIDLWPGLIEQFGGIEKYHKTMRPTHPIFLQYKSIKERLLNVEYLRKRTIQNIKNIILLKIFIARWRNNFLNRYYAPITGTGYKKALNEYNTIILQYNLDVLLRND